MPSADTFSIPIIGDWVKSHIAASTVSIDPFARNNRWATHTNDLSPETSAEYHMEALEFLATLHAAKVKADLVIFDPPYSPRQISECYSQIGRQCTMQDTQSKTWMEWRNAIALVCAQNATVLSFGWNSVGMGKNRGFEPLEILLVCHGGAHNDTICMSEKHHHKDSFLFQ